MRIGEMLVAEGRLSAKQVERARQVQRNFGGRLGTSLLELGLVDEETLLATLGRQRSTRVVSATELAKAPAAVVRLIPAKLADEPEIEALARAFGVPVILDSNIIEGSFRAAAYEQAPPE